MSTTKVTSRQLSTKAEIYRFDIGSNVYLLNLDEPVVIDTGERSHRDQLMKSFAEVLPFDKVKKVIFTHLHYDHIGNFDLFRNAKFYASAKEIEEFRHFPIGTVLDESLAKEFAVKLNPIKNFGPFEIIEVPGHTAGSICVLYKPEGILFSGDTFFKKGVYGRTDLPTSAPDKLDESLKKISKLKARIICPGHDY